MLLKLSALILCLFPITLTAQSAASAQVASGFITSVEPDGRFTVEGWPVHLEPHATFFVNPNPGTATSSSIFQPFVGEFVEVYGSRSTGKSVPRSILATRLVQVMPDLDGVHGTAIIDFVPLENPLAPDHVVRADGRFLRIPTTAKVKFEDGVAADSAFATNMWIAYKGIQQNDGTILVETATIRKNTVKEYEEQLHQKSEYDPGAVSPDEKQGTVNKLLHGIDVKKLHPHPDEILQARINKIGDRLVPAYQRALATDDPTRFSFRFQVVDLEGYHEPLALTNGIILVPFLGLDRLKSDSDLAAPLAIAMAFALEKEQVRGRATKNTLKGAAAAGYASDVLLFPVGIVGGIAAGMAQKHINDLQSEQAGRVALCLMHDAGYDIRQAPIALWLLDPNDPQPIEKARMPKRAADLYKTLGTVWQPGSLARTTNPAPAP